MLTKEEKINIAKFVMESYQGITITEAKSNNNIREEIQMNFKYYTAIKEIFNGKFMRFVRKRQINEKFSAPKMCENCVESWDTSLDFWKKPDLVKK